MRTMRIQARPKITEVVKNSSVAGPLEWMRSTLKPECCGVVLVDMPFQDCMEVGRLG